MRHLRGWVMRRTEEGHLPGPFYAKEDGLYVGPEHTSPCYTWPQIEREGWICKPIEITELYEPEPQQYIPKGEACLVWDEGSNCKWLWFSLGTGSYTPCSDYVKDNAKGSEWNHAWPARIPPIETWDTAWIGAYLYEESNIMYWSSIRPGQLAPGNALYTIWRKDYDQT